MVWRLFMSLCVVCDNFEEISWYIKDVVVYRNFQNKKYISKTLVMAFVMRGYICVVKKLRKCWEMGKFRKIPWVTI